MSYLLMDWKQKSTSKKLLQASNFFFFLFKLYSRSMSRAITWPCISTVILKDVPDTALTSAACDKLTEGDLPLVRSSQSGIQRNVSR